MIKIYGHPSSSAGRTYWTLEEIGLDYEPQEFSFKNGDHKKEWFLKLNPNGKVPTLVDGDYVIWDSSAIDFYLARKYKPELTGKSPEEEGQISQWCYWAVADLQPPLITAFIQKVFIPEDRRDQKVIDDNIKKATRYFDILEKMLEGRNYIVGDSFTLADISVGYVLNILETLEYDLADYPIIKSWLNSMKKRDSYKKAFMTH